MHIYESLAWEQWLLELTTFKQSQASSFQSFCYAKLSVSWLVLDWVYKHEGGIKLLSKRWVLVPKCETVPFPVLRAATLIVKLNISTLSKCYNSVVLFRPLRVALYSAAVIPSVGRYSSTVRNFSNLWDLPMICSVHFYSMYLTVHIVVQSVVIILIQEFVFSFFCFCE